MHGETEPAALGQLPAEGVLDGDPRALPDRVGHPRLVRDRDGRIERAVVESTDRAMDVKAYPVLLDVGDSVALRVVTTPELQQRIMRERLRLSLPEALAAAARVCQFVGRESALVRSTGCP